MSVRWCPFSGYFGSFMLVDRHRRQDFWTHMFKQNLKRRKIGPKKTEFKQERHDRPKSVFEKCLKNFPQAMYAQKYRIVFYWIHMFGVKPHKNQPFQPEDTSNTSDWRVRTNLNGTAQKPWRPPLPRGCNLVMKHNYNALINYADNIESVQAQTEPRFYLCGPHNVLHYC